jgi:hypothetical protein
MGEPKDTSIALSVDFGFFESALRVPSPND